MPNSPRTSSSGRPDPLMLRVGGGIDQQADDSDMERNAALFRRPRRASTGFWLGGVILGTAGCILGACMPYRHQVAVGLSVLWWGLYCGCAGAGLGALLAWMTERGSTVTPSKNDLVRPAFTAQCASLASAAVSALIGSFFSQEKSRWNFREDLQAEDEAELQFLRVEIAHLQTRVQGLQHHLDRLDCQRHPRSGDRSC